MRQSCALSVKVQPEIPGVESGSLGKIDRAGKIRLGSAMITHWLLGTVLLERNRWRNQLPPALPLHRWMEPILQAGFDGVEVWERHWWASEAPAALELLLKKGRTTLFNTYADLAGNEAARGRRKAVAEAAARLGAAGLKFNTGPSAESWEAEREEALVWADLLPPGVRLLCEGHSGTSLETPTEAARSLTFWPPERFGMIVHPCSFATNGLEAWMHCCGDRVVHLHWQLRRPESGWRALRDERELVRQALRTLREYRFHGTATLEFTQGVQTPDETPESLLENARLDVAFLREEAACLL